MSTGAIERVLVFDLLVANNGRLTTSHIVESLNTTPPTAKRTMVEFKAIGLVNLLSLGPEENAEKQIILKSEFDWFLSKEFLDLRKGFIPPDFSEYLKEPKKNPPRLQIILLLNPQDRESLMLALETVTSNDFSQSCKKCLSRGY